jgi:hypothetical protein
LNTIQGDSGGKVNIFGDDSVGHCEEKCSYQREYNSEWLLSWSSLNPQIQKTVNGNEETEIILLFLIVI